MAREAKSAAAAATATAVEGVVLEVREVTQPLVATAPEQPTTPTRLSMEVEREKELEMENKVDKKEESVAAADVPKEMAGKRAELCCVVM